MRCVPRTNCAADEVGELTRPGGDEGESGDVFPGRTAQRTRWESWRDQEETRVKVEMCSQDEPYSGRGKRADTTRGRRGWKWRCVVNSRDELHSGRGWRAEMCSFQGRAAQWTRLESWQEQGETRVKVEMCYFLGRGGGADTTRDRRGWKCGDVFPGRTACTADEVGELTDEFWPWICVQ